MEIQNERLLGLLKRALTAIHDFTGEEHCYETLYDLQDKIGITDEEYSIIMNIE